VVADDAGTIDLGVQARDGADHAPERDRPASWWRWWTGRYRRRRRVVRRWGQVLLVLAVSLPLAAAAPPAPARLAPLWTDASLTLSGAAPSPSPVAHGPHLYAIQPYGAGQVLTARLLRDGKTVWQVVLDVPGEAVGLQVSAGVPVVTTDSPHAAAYDPHSGQVAWERPGVPDAQADGVLLVTAEAESGRRVVTAVAPDSGQVVGAAVVPAYQARTTWRAPGGTVHLFTLDTDGRLTRQVLGDGREEDGTVHGEQAGSGRGSLAVRHGLVLVTDRTAPDRATLAHDATTLEHRWTVPDAYATAVCGPVLCVYVSGAGGPSVWGVHPATGTIAWTARCADVGISGAPCRLAVHALADGDRLWIEAVTPDRYTGGTRARSWIARATTGGRLTSPDGWALRQRVDGAGLLLGRSDLDRAPERPGGPFRLWWAHADADGSSVEVLGTVDATDCRPHHPYLVCWTEGEGVTVWGIGP
jgi:outer membrane protein assembly factor BamB